MAETTCETDDVFAVAADAASRDAAFSALAHPYRRHLLVVLRGLETPERLDALTRSLAVEMDVAGGERVEEMYVLLRHAHVPKLAACGLVSHDAERETVELTEDGRALADVVAT